MEKSILFAIRAVAFLVLLLIVLSSNHIYNQKIVALKTDQIIESIENKSFAVWCVPSSIVIDQKTQTVITSLDCDRGSSFIESGYDSGIHFVTGDYSDLTGTHTGSDIGTGQRLIE